MSELRQDVIDAMVKHFEDQRGHPPEQMQIEDLTDYADEVLQALAERNDTQQVVREQIAENVTGYGAHLEAAMTIIAPHLARAAAAVEVTERLQVKIRELDRAVVEWHDRAERAEAELADLRQQLDQVRAARDSWRRNLDVPDSDLFAAVSAILDAPTRPAETKGTDDG
jgi:chromosome segregation ATPase